MHRDARGFIYCYLLAIGGVLLAGSGCSFVKVPQGWMLSTGWSLEFHRMPFNASCEKSCNVTSCNPGGNADCANPSGETSLPAEPIEPTPALSKGEGELPGGGDSSGLMNLLKRRGRLGICATCGKMGRFKEPQPALASTAPVLAKFHPVPSAPVFCPQPNSTKPVDFQVPAGKKKTAPSKKSPLPPQPGNAAPPTPQPEIIPPPPASVRGDKSERVPRELEVPPEPPNWVFTPTSEKRPDPVIEAQSQPTRTSEPSARR